MEFSQSSTASTIPYELGLNSDVDFLQELEIVNELYFGHTPSNENSDVGVETYVEDNADNDSDSDSNLFDIENENVSANSVVNENIDPELMKEEDFFLKGCGCSRLYNKRPCSSVIDREMVENYRMHMLEKTKSELDLIIKSQLFHHRATVNSGIGRQRSRQRYYFAGKSVCRSLFAFAHGVHRKTVDSIGRSIDETGIEERVHGNKQGIPKHALKLDEVNHVKNFLLTYATQNGIPLPGRMAKFRNVKNVLLPSDKNKADIYSLYCEASESAGIRQVALKTFYRLWQEHCPNIIIMKPATDLCTTCQKYAQTLVNSGNCTEEEKQQQLDMYSDHLRKVQCQRDHYRHQCERSKFSFESLLPENQVRGQASCSVDNTVVYSFDYAQQVLYPHYAQQVGPIFFRTPRKCQCFGVCCESSGTQIFYLIDEGEGAGKGANSVTSMLHHHFLVHGYGEKHVMLNMDNCSGQNKNNTVIGYGLWRVLTGAHQTVEYSLMEAGHTKFSPDWHFGLWKVRWRHSTAECTEDIADTVRRSSRSGHNIPQLVDDAQNPVLFHDWSTFLKQFFRKIPNITKYHYFRMTAASPGKIFMKQYMFSPEEEFQVLKHSVTINGFPERVNSPGLDPARQWYLYEEIAPLCLDGSKACPKPVVPKPKTLKIEGQDTLKK